MSSKAGVVIVGAGVIGCSIAYYLAKEGVVSQIIERDALGSQASGVAVGILAPAVAAEEEPRSLLGLGIESLRMHRQLAPELREEAKVDVHFADLPVFLLAFTEEEERHLREQIAWEREAGLEVAWVGVGELRSLGLSGGVRGALLCSDTAQVDSYRLTLAFAQGAEARGASIRQGEVIGLRHKGPRVTALTLVTGEVGADSVVLAMGPWNKAGGSWLGVNFPIVPMRGQLLKVRMPQPPRYAPFYGESHVVPKVDGSVLVGGTREFVGFDNRVTEEAKSLLISRALSLVPSLAEAEVVDFLAGLRPFCEDGLPILGRLQGWDNVYIAGGHGRQGILLSPITGRIVADLLLRGRTDLVDIRPFSPARFE